MNLSLRLFAAIILLLFVSTFEPNSINGQKVIREGLNEHQTHQHYNEDFDSEYDIDSDLPSNSRKGTIGYGNEKHDMKSHKKEESKQINNFLNKLDHKPNSSQKSHLTTKNSSQHHLTHSIGKSESSDNVETPSVTKQSFNDHPNKAMSTHNPDLSNNKVNEPQRQTSLTTDHRTYHGPAKSKKTDPSSYPTRAKSNQRQMTTSATFKLDNFTGKADRDGFEEPKMNSDNKNTDNQNRKLDRSKASKPLIGFGEERTKFVSDSPRRTTGSFNRHHSTRKPDIDKHHSTGRPSILHNHATNNQYHSTNKPTTETHHASVNHRTEKPYVKPRYATDKKNHPTSKTYFSTNYRERNNFAYPSSSNKNKTAVITAINETSDLQDGKSSEHIGVIPSMKPRDSRPSKKRSTTTTLKPEYVDFDEFRKSGRSTFGFDDKISHQTRSYPEYMKTDSSRITESHKSFMSSTNKPLLSLKDESNPDTNTSNNEKEGAYVRRAYANTKLICGDAPKRGKRTSHITPRISNSFGVTPGQFPQMATVKVVIGTKPNTCTGVLVDDMHILTAGHCVSDINTRSIEVTVSSDNIIYNNSKPVRSARKRSMTRVCFHDDFVFKPSIPDYDLAIIKLPERVKLNDYVQPACIPTLKLKDGDICYLVGQGRINSERKNQRMFMNYIMVEKVHCKHESHDKSCFKSNDQDFPGKACLGDSGAPVLCEINGKWQVHGIISSSTMYCDDEKKSNNPDIVFDIQQNYAAVNRLMKSC